MIFADAGIPMLALAMPGMVLALPLVIGIEAALLKHGLRVSLGTALWVSTVANLASTVLGVPLTWVALLFGEMIVGVSFAWIHPTAPQTFLGKVVALVVQAPWLAPSDEDPYWMVPAAVLVLLVPFWLASYVTECKVARWMLRTAEPTGVSKVIWRANVVTYALFGIGVAGWLVWSVKQGPSN